MLCYVHIGLFLEKTNPVVNPVVASQKFFYKLAYFFGKSLKTKQPGLGEKYLDAILVLQVFQKYLRKISIFTHFFACLMRKNIYI